MICGLTPHLWIGVWVGGGVDGWVNCHLIEIIEFCLKIYDLRRHPTYGWVYGWMGGLLGGSVGGVMSNQ